MMKKCNFLFFVGILLTCMLLCGCADEKKDLILIGSEASVDEAKETGRETFPEPETELIKVYVCGAVMSPGVVELTVDSRAEAALEAAGGFRGDASKEYVNLAARLEDGQMLWFPTKEQVEESKEAASGLVNINTADVAALCSLPGIGESRAKDIILYREKNGGFAKCEDIMKVSGIKESIYGKICDKITVQ